MTIRTEPTALAALLGTELTDEPVRRSRAQPNGLSDSSQWVGWDDGAEEVKSLRLRYPRVHAALKADSGDRSADTIRLIYCCRANGLTANQTRWVVGQREDCAERLTERFDRNGDDDFERCWQRAEGADDEEDENVSDTNTTTGTKDKTKPNRQGAAYKITDVLAEDIESAVPQWGWTYGGKAPMLRRSRFMNGRERRGGQARTEPSRTFRYSYLLRTLFALFTGSSDGNRRMTRTDGLDRSCGSIPARRTPNWRRPTSARASARSA
ncbi:hypothetical protein OG921_13010 [Aldersonia sp. NBC_00410]|uniref:hypothetical protein n=1 Tax=Aldersonia sp. NBC_00410 TaxID=2975954 RepID=UPI00225A7866|nr:hypothetical protein [Aldersonia sp. NBC_00410]MCX5044085.1 hypothetical protein [Aldersonia sp. NBC_00410]